MRGKGRTLPCVGETGRPRGEDGGPGKGWDTADTQSGRVRRINHQFEWKRETRETDTHPLKADHWYCGLIVKYRLRRWHNERTLRIRCGRDLRERVAFVKIGRR